MQLPHPKFWYFHRQATGFTLVELLVVIGIIGILATIGITTYTGSQGKARDARRKSDLHQLQVALQQYYNDNGKFPDTTGIGGGWVSDQWSGWTTLLGANTANYIKIMPTDPVDTTGTNGYPKGDANDGYVYYYYSVNGTCGISNNQFYLIAAHIEAPSTYAGTSLPWPSTGSCSNIQRAGWYMVENP